MAKVLIEEMLNDSGKSFKDFDIEVPEDIDVEKENEWDCEEELKLGTIMRNQMTNDQEKIVKEVFDILDKKKKVEDYNGCLFIDGPGGCGKTYTYCTCCHLFRAKLVK